MRFFHRNPQLIIFPLEDTQLRKVRLRDFVRETSEGLRYQSLMVLLFNAQISKWFINFFYLTCCTKGIRLRSLSRSKLQVKNIYNDCLQICFSFFALNRNYWNWMWKLFWKGTLWSQVTSGDEICFVYEKQYSPESITSLSLKAVDWL